MVAELESTNKRGEMKEEPPSNIAVSSITLRNFLSFGPDNEPLPLQPLNILIGANAIGKSNLIDAFALLRAAANNSVAEFISKRGGVGQWLWKGQADAQASIEVVIPYSLEDRNDEVDELRFVVAFSESKTHEPRVVSQWLDRVSKVNGRKQVKRIRTYVGDEDKGKSRAGNGTGRTLTLHEVGSGSLEDYKASRIGGFVASLLRSFVLYRNWNFSRDPLHDVRRPLSVGATSKSLSEDASNLAAVLKHMCDLGLKDTLIDYLRQLDAYAVSFDVNEIGTPGTPPLYQLVVEEHGDERNFIIDASRLSDGTMRWLALLAVLLHPTPPRLVCLEGPEVGLHHDLLPVLADLLRDAATRTQLIVVTESLSLISSFSRTPGVVLVCNKVDGATRINRLDPDLLNPLLEKYKLGALWSMGQIGGNRF